VGLISRAIEAAGIRTVQITHLPNVTKQSRPPRSLYLRFPLGRSFGAAHQQALQRSILLDALQYAIKGEPEGMLELPYRWKKMKEEI
jgi:D-proline reductase (dithiol) PrdB